MHIPLALSKKYNIKRGDMAYFFTMEDFEVGKLDDEAHKELEYFIVGIRHKGGEKAK